VVDQRESGQPFTYATCVELGPTIAYDEAHTRSRSRRAEFIRVALKG